MTGAAERDGARLGVVDGVQERRHLTVLEGIDEVPHLRGDDRGRVALERVGAQRVAELAHQCRGPLAAPGHVAHGHHVPAFLAAMLAALLPSWRAARANISATLARRL